MLTVGKAEIFSVTTVNNYSVRAPTKATRPIKIGRAGQGALEYPDTDPL